MLDRRTLFNKRLRRVVLALSSKSLKIFRLGSSIYSKMWQMSDSFPLQVSDKLIMAFWSRQGCRS